MAHLAQNSVGPLFLAKQKLRQLRDIGSDPPRLVLGEQLGRRSLPMATQQTAQVTITATDMTAAERGFRAIQELIVAAAMIGTIRTRRENLKSAVTATPERYSGKQRTNPGSFATFGRVSAGLERLSISWSGFAHSGMFSLLVPRRWRMRAITQTSWSLPASATD